MDSDRGKRYGTDQTNTACRSFQHSSTYDSLLGDSEGLGASLLGRRNGVLLLSRKIVDARGDWSAGYDIQRQFTIEHAAPVLYETHLFVMARLLDEIMRKVNPADVAKTWTHDMYEETAAADR